MTVHIVHNCTCARQLWHYVVDFFTLAPLYGDVLHLDLMVSITHEAIEIFLCLMVWVHGPVSVSGSSFVTQHMTLLNSETAGCLQITPTTTNFKETMHRTKQLLILYTILYYHAL